MRSNNYSKIQPKDLNLIWSNNKDRSSKVLSFTNLDWSQLRGGGGGRGVGWCAGMAGVRTVSLGGTEPFPTKYKAKKYKLHDHFITKKAFVDMMNNLPEKVGTENGEGENENRNWAPVFIWIKGERWCNDDNQLSHLIWVNTEHHNWSRWSHQVSPVFFLPTKTHHPPTITIILSLLFRNEIKISAADFSLIYPEMQNVTLESVPFSLSVSLNFSPSSVGKM